MSKGAIAIYRWRVAPDAEDYFRKTWHDVTLDIRENYGGCGSCLTRAANGEFVGIALWRSKAARDAAWAKHGDPEPHRGVEMVDETWLEVEDDLWLKSSFD